MGLAGVTIACLAVLGAVPLPVMAVGKWPQGGQQATPTRRPGQAQKQEQLPQRRWHQQQPRQQPQQGRATGLGTAFPSDRQHEGARDRRHGGAIVSGSEDANALDGDNRRGSRPAPGRGKVFLPSLVTVTENSLMNDREATAKFLEGHNRPEVMAAVAGAVLALAPKTARLAAAHRLGDATAHAGLGNNGRSSIGADDAADDGNGNVGRGVGACATAPDGGVARVFGAFRSVCSLREVDAALRDVVLGRQLVIPPSLRGCEGCEAKFKSAAVGVIQAYDAAGEDALPRASVHGVFESLCGPLAEALLDECGGGRRGVNVADIAHE